MTILAINAYHADSSAAILVDGKLIAATEEERFTRIKHWAGFPSLAIAFCLKQAGVSLADVDHIAIGRDPKAKFLNKLLFLLRQPSGSLKTALGRVANARKIDSLEKEFLNLGGNSSKPVHICKVEHHRSHLASAFFASPFEEAALLSVDGSGDFTTTMRAVGKAGKISVLDSMDFPVSVGTFYTAFTQLLGFPHYGDEYKVMGLAPYGEPRFLSQLGNVIQLTKNGLFSWDSRYFRSALQVTVEYGTDHMPQIASLFSPYMEQQFGKARKASEELTQHHKDLAASVQRFTENLIIHIAGSLQRKTGLKKLCLAGGVAQNSVANGKILNHTDFEDLYIPAAGHDAGTSVGAALYVYNQLLRFPRAKPLRSAYTGSRYTNLEIETLLKSRKINYRHLDDEVLCQTASERIVGGGVIGWFHGRAEFGPRALGARSILADPRRNDAKELINLKIKRRESFRPFAPSVLKEYVKDFFECNEEVLFMEKVFPVLEKKRGEIPAVTHVDGTGRLQTVDREISPLYYRLIDCFRQKTGIPILLNTSFNENEPIVNSPEEALNCFLRTDMDMLVMENIVIER